MAIMVVYDASGLTLQDYDHVRAAIGWEADLPDGSFMHLLGHDNNGLLNIELWESQALFDTYVRERFNPAFDRLGLPHPPPPRIMALHNGLQLQDAEAHVPRTSAGVSIA